MKRTAELLAAGGNEHPSTADADHPSGLVAFGTGQNVALWQPSHDGGSGIRSLLSGHTGLVNAVKFVHLDLTAEPLILSGAADKTVRVWWPCAPEESVNGYICRTVLPAHTKSVNAIAVLQRGNLFFSAGADSELKVWRITEPSQIEHAIDGPNNRDTALLQTISTKPSFIPMALALTCIPGSEALVLAAAGSKPVISIYVAEGASANFTLAATLSGHEGWIRSLDFIIDQSSQDDQSLILASASQDKYIRLWRLQAANGKAHTSSMANFDAMATMIGGAISNKAHRFSTQGKKHSIAFEALLVGHEDWIFSVKWLKGNGTLRLLSASADNSLAIWEPDESSGVWTSTVRLGEISGQKGATTATGSTGGFWLGLWNDDGCAVLSLGKTGSWRLWRLDTKDGQWLQDVAVTGHTRSVDGIAWARDGSYLLSTSSDKTTRMWAPTKTDGAWHEISRAQIHGYELNCIDTISNVRFISGADEKLLRVFEQPKAVAKRLSDACGIRSHVNGTAIEAANMPVLGLSNKAIESEPSGEDEVDGDHSDNLRNGGAKKSLVDRDMTEAPTEDQLSRQLLWPEVEKLYGHGYEICACTVSRDGKLVATACKASSVTHAAIRIYRTSDWQLKQPPLEAHSLSVTRLRFSPDDRYLLSVSRDRQCAVLECVREDSYVLLKDTLQRAHTRMVLDATWLPSYKSKSMFATAGRDKAVHIWRLNVDESDKAHAAAKLEKAQTINADLPVTAIDCSSEPDDRFVLLAYGLEDGSVFTSKLDLQDVGAAFETVRMNADISPSKSITQLAWMPKASSDGDDDGRISKLAVSSEDCSVRVIRIQLEANSEQLDDFPAHPNS